MPGVRVIALDYRDPRGRLALRDGTVVVVEQFTHDGSLRELSAKQIELYDDRIESLAPARTTRGTGQSPCQETAAPTGGRSAGGGDRARNYQPGTLALGASLPR